jgi:ribulose bisphosphate carboxylase small subunit
MEGLSTGDLSSMAFYIAPTFLDKLAVHITKNYLDLPQVKVPLILGVHGRKGEGKSFQCDLVFQRMGIEVVYMSAGELESPDAGDPARLIRLRYREAGELVKIRGKMAVLMINDIDAGIGRVDGMTQYTVNTQLVHGTLMNIADNPTNVQLPGNYNNEATVRIPIIVTGNDFSTLYAPLVRDGRMEKYYWEPTARDRIGIVSGMFAGDRIGEQNINTLVSHFSEQSIDFFGALRSRLFDEQVKRFIDQVGVEQISARVVNSAQKPPEFHAPDFSLDHLIENGAAIVREQQRLQELRLVEEYNQSAFQPKAASVVAAVSHPIAEALPVSQSSLNAEIVGEVNRILGQNQRLGIEYVDDRRFRTGSWQCYSTFEGQGSDALAAMENCLRDHPRDYIRLVGIEPKDRRRLTELLVQRSS